MPVSYIGTVLKRQYCSKLTDTEYLEYFAAA